MEDRSRPSGDDKETTVAASDTLETRQSRAREGLESILSRWREVLHGEDPEKEDSSEDDDSETETVPQPRGSRLRGFLKSFMPRPDRIPEDGHHRETADTGHFLRDEVPEHADVVPPHTEVIEDTIDSIDTPDLSSEEDLIRSDPALEATPADIIDSIDTPDLDEDMAYRRTPTTPTPTPAGVLPAYRPEAVTDATPVPDVLPSPVDRDRSMRGAVAGLLTVDVLNYAAAKHRDNKNKAENERQHTKIERSLTQEKQAREHLESRTRALEAKRIRTTTERPMPQEVSPQVERQNAQRPIEHRREAVVTERPIVLPEVTPQRPLEIFERRQTFDGPEVPVEKILKQVEEAAEKNVAIETLYERRHESKGAEDNANLVGTPNASITTPSTGAGGGFGGAYGSGQSYGTNHQPANLSETHKKELQEMYKKAAQTSSVIALILLLVYFIAVVLSRN